MSNNKKTPDFEDIIVVEDDGNTWRIDSKGFRIIDNPGPEGVKPDEKWFNYIRKKQNIPELTEEHRKVLESVLNHFNKDGFIPHLKILSNEVNIPVKKICKLFNSKYCPFRKRHSIIKIHRILAIMAGLPSGFLVLGKMINGE